MLKSVTRSGWALLALFSWPVAGLAAEPATVSNITRRVGRLDFSPCTLSGGLLGHSVDAQCTTLRVAENREAKNGRGIDLSIAMVPAIHEAVADPVFMLAGGPGQSARESFPAIAAAFGDVSKTHDIVLVDQRGTGSSNRLGCQTAELDGGVEGDDPDFAKVKAEAAACAHELAAKADLRFYSTTDAIIDLDDVREALGAPTINLVGISYGTRVAQQYAKRYPSHTRTVTLDGVVPNTLVLGNDHAKNLERSLGLQLAQCTHDERCLKKLGDPRQRLEALFALLKTASPLVHYRDAMTGQMKEEHLTRGHVALVARMYAYMPMLAGLLPLVLFEASEGRYEPLMSLASLTGATLGQQFSTGMQNCVLCTEDASELTLDPADTQTVLGTVLLRASKAICEVWPHGTRPADFRTPLKGAVPVLVLSGELDPVTPPRYGDEVAASLPNGRHLVIEGQGHNVLPVGCVPKLLSKFIASADAKTLEVGCLATVPKAKPFIDFYGWEP